MKYKSLKTRVLVWFGSVISVLLLLFGFSFSYFFNENTKLTIETSLHHQAIYIYENILPDLRSGGSISHGKNYTAEVAIVKNDIIIKKTDKFVLNKPLNYLHKEDNFFIIGDEEDINALYVLRFRKPFNGAIIINEKEVDDKAEDVIDTLLVLNPILLFLLMIIGSKLIDKILLPIKNITQKTKEISITDFSNTITEPVYEDEIKDLVTSFNKMIIRLKNGVNRLDRFNSDVSHELKTPLTVIKGEIEIALIKVRDIGYYENSMQIILYEANQIQKIVEDLLILTKYSKDNISQYFQSCELDVILLETIERYSSQMRYKNINLHVQIFESIVMNANPSLVSAIYSNLIDNSIKYSQNDTNIYISLYQDVNIHFSIQDEGIGIPKDHVKKVTDRFYRVDESRNKKIKGFGLGLSIVDNSVFLHDGTLEIDSLEGSGTTVHIIF